MGNFPVQARPVRVVRCSTKRMSETRRTTSLHTLFSAKSPLCIRVQVIGHTELNVQVQVPFTVIFLVVNWLAIACLASVRVVSSVHIIACAARYITVFAVAAIVVARGIYTALIARSIGPPREFATWSTHTLLRVARLRRSWLCFTCACTISRRCARRSTRLTLNGSRLRSASASCAARAPTVRVIVINQVVFLATIVAS